MAVCPSKEILSQPRIRHYNLTRVYISPIEESSSVLNQSVFMNNFINLSKPGVDNLRPLIKMYAAMHM